MKGNSVEKFRRERRKEARLEKKKKMFSSWQSSKLRKSFLDTKPVFGKKLEKNNELSLSVEEKKNMLRVSDTLIKGDFGGPSMAKKKMAKNKKSRTKFGEYLEMEMGRSNISAGKDLKLERELAKKLKVKNGKLGGPDDDISLLLGGIPSVFDSMEEEDVVENSRENGEQGVSDEEVESEMESISLDEDSDLSHASSEEYDKGEELIAPKNSREKKRTRKTNFEEYLDMEEMQGGALAGDMDKELEKKLAKKLKIKQGKLHGDDGNINSLFMGISSALDSLKDSGTQGTENDLAKNLDRDSLSRKSSATKSTGEEQAMGIFSTTDNI